MIQPKVRKFELHSTALVTGLQLNPVEISYNIHMKSVPDVRNETLLLNASVRIIDGLEI